MSPQKDGSFWRSKYAIIIYGVLIIVVILVFTTRIFDTKEPGAMPAAIWLMLGIIALIALIIILATALKILDTVANSDIKLDRVSAELEKAREILAKVNQVAHLSEAAKLIAFREDERRSLQDAVFDKLQQKDFDAAYEIIDEIAHLSGYKKLADQLRNQANTYRDSPDSERANQVITYVEKLIENHQWQKATTNVDKLLKAYPNSEKIKQLKQKLTEKKEERKKVLLNAWDDAVKRQATDRSLEILRELDQYLTANEALALQEAARDVFRTKLHNLGVQFSLAVSGRQWKKALDAGEEIVRDFPNSRMAEEIREKLNILRQNVTQKTG